VRRRIVSRPPDGAQFAVIDLETSGLRAETDSILQVAIVHQDWEGRRLAEWSSYVRPPQRWRSPLGPVEIHGITRRHVLFAPDVSTVMADVVALTRDLIVVAHNAPFDLGFLRAAATRTSTPLRIAGVVCTLQLSRQLGERGQANHKLVSLCAEFGVDPGRAHHALHDARAAGAVLPHLLGGLGITSVAELEPQVRR
jgi:DNA polymerase-3 subunit epsilon